MRSANNPSQRSAPCAVLSLDIRAARVWPQAWRLLPTHAKLLTAMADASGLTVINAEGVWVWGGTQEQFSQSGVFKPSQDWDFGTRGQAETDEGDHATLWRSTRDCPDVAARMRFNKGGPRSAIRLAAIAAADKQFQVFRSTLLAPVSGLIYEPIPPLEEGWEGPIRVFLTASAFGHFMRAGVFRQFWMAAEYQVSESMARALIAYAAEQPGQTMAALRKRVCIALTAHECAERADHGRR